MEKWIGVVTDPLGIAGFALFLLFLLVSKLTSRSDRRWLMPFFAIMAGTTLLGGLGLAWMSQTELSQMPSVPGSEPKTIIQKSQGKGSPPIGVNTGEVTITIDDSSHHDDADQPPAK